MTVQIAAIIFIALWVFWSVIHFRGGIERSYILAALFGIIGSVATIAVSAFVVLVFSAAFGYYS